MWDVGAIGTAEYGGAALRDVLRHCGLDPDDPAAAGVRHVHFQGADEVPSPLHLYLHLPLTHALAH